MQARWRNGLPAAAIAAFAVALAAPPADAACGGVKRAQPQRSGGQRPPLVIGDSVLLGAIPQVAAAGFEVNTRGCRQRARGCGSCAPGAVRERSRASS